ncbi:hypothetical protein EDC14_1005175 [Hydrogenispora ethanolica]|uniref:Polymerase/histidinol phosphatase N-terminal domain-containing protein n=1 Tax=Hydrogenispora ethanolica TaxID=1082276 RepID=A0A4R1S2B1_HYDET|nr:CehA/McbA family metallohydrolase [Hydrogenispora ethanolica]TCL73313.1 hypothetical protein EDC14_1005175 [Hydrogenispora ethanolica]
MNRWLSFELHAHTLHSDGAHTLAELAGFARQRGYDGLAVTDHNTIAAWAEWEAVTAATGVRILPGLEWTTFHGHALLLNIPQYVDWRALGTFDLERGIRAVHDQGGLFGIAHPFRLGNPICTGGYWEYRAGHGSADYLEVWSQSLPAARTGNQRAFQWWTRLLDAGCRITAVAGSDLHRLAPAEALARTYLAVDGGDDPGPAAAIRALRSGAVTVSMGPLVTVELRSAAQSWGAGSVVPAADRPSILELEVALRSTAQMAWVEIDRTDFRAVISSNRGEVCQVPLGLDGAARRSIDVNGLRWMRAELFGRIQGVAQLIAFSNPIYFQI